MSAEWSAKSGVQRESAERQVQTGNRKASADKEPTTHANTLGGQRPRADSERKRAFRRARFSVHGLWGGLSYGKWEVTKKHR